MSSHQHTPAVGLYCSLGVLRGCWLRDPLSEVEGSRLVRFAGESAGLQGVHLHMLRHSCGYYLADKGTDLRTMQDYLGHRDPRHTVHYTRVAGRRFEGLWK